MWILVWLSFIDGRFEYYQLGSYGTEAHCNKEKIKAEVMVKNGYVRLKIFLKNYFASLDF